MISYQFRLYPTTEHIEALNQQLDTHRWLYNQALEQRKTAWEEKKESIGYNQQAGWLTKERETNEYLTQVNVSSCQRTLKRLDRAFQSFFGRIKTGETPGYPRFKGRNRFDSFEFTYSDGIKIKGDTLYIQHIGHVEICLHRAIEGKIKTAIIKRKANQWFVCFSVECESHTQSNTGQCVGLDMGVKNLVTTSDGEFFSHPKHLRQSERNLRCAQRKVSRREKGSHRRQKAVIELKKVHEQIANQRRDTSHKIARSLVNRYDLIAVEDLQVKNMMQNHSLAKSIADASWSTFINILSFKAEDAGRQVVKVDPKYTSQACSRCGEIVQKDLSVRIHECLHCGLTLDRDVNAAKNVLKKALRGWTIPSGVNVEVVNSCVS